MGNHNKLMEVKEVMEHRNKAMVHLNQTWDMVLLLQTWDTVLLHQDMALLDMVLLHKTWDMVLLLQTWDMALLGMVLLHQTWDMVLLHQDSVDHLLVHFIKKIVSSLFLLSF